MTNDTLHEQLRAALTRRPGQVLETLAHKYQCSLQTVIEALPEEMWRKTGGTRLIEFLQTVATWPEAVTFIIHTTDAIVEVSGRLPNGHIAHGFYNFAAGTPLHGHIHYQNCAAIYLVTRPFMGMTTQSLVFINKQGWAMFKIFVGRDGEGKLLPSQAEAMRRLFTDAA